VEPPASPRLLILETSGRVGEVGVAVGPTPAALRRLDAAQRHARDLAPAVAELLHGQGWRARDLDAVLVSRGPGSYTGLRVGVMSAKALAYAAGCALLLVDTFAAVAEQAPPDAARLDVLADAQQDKVYVQPFGREEGRWRALAALAVRPFADWLAGRDAAAWLTGPGLSKWRTQLPGDARVLDEARWEPRAASVLTLGLARYRAGERDDVWAAEPLYLRASSAEEQWRARQGGG
jgi:tRNA threonylcarbamoyladenosine biosynthesis protein TsaB